VKKLVMKGRGADRVGLPLSVGLARNPEDRLFPISYGSCRVMLLREGKILLVETTRSGPHSSTFPSRSGVPIEIVNKVIVRPANLSTTQRDLGKISDIEATGCVEKLFG
jgi:integrase/recombinase XerD